MFVRLLLFLLFVGFCTLVVKAARKAWRRADLEEKVEREEVEEKLEELKEEKELVAKVIDINTKEAIDNKEKLEEFKKL